MLFGCDPMPNRPYQTAILREVERLFASGYKRLLLQCPTGGGKTRMAVQLVSRAGWRNVMYVVPSNEIFEQTSEKLDALKIRHVRLKAGKRPSLRGESCVLAMSQTLARRKNDAMFDDWQPHFLVVDEIHKLIDQHRSILDIWKCLIVGMTATPVRLDGKSLGGICPNMIVGPSIRQLQKDGFLVPSITYPAPMPDLRGLTISRGDFERNRLERAYLNSGISEIVPRYWKLYAKGRRTITFATGIETSQKMVASYRAAGIRAEHIDGSTPPRQRQQALERLRKHKIDVLCNVGLFIEGLDLVEVDCITLVFATQSTSKFLQSVGRGLRLSPRTQKKNLIVIDHGGNSLRHGPVDADRDWLREGRFVGSLPVRCRACSAYRSPTKTKCPHCGWEERRGPRVSRVAQTRSRKWVSERTPVRPCPTWAIPVRGVWQQSERQRARYGYRLPDRTCRGYSESQCLRALADQKGEEWATG